MRKSGLCICENKDTDQLHGNGEADQRLCFRSTDSMIPLLSKSKILSLWPSSVSVQPALCGTWSETPKTGFLRTRLISQLSVADETMGTGLLLRLILPRKSLVRITNNPNMTSAVCRGLKKTIKQTNHLNAHVAYHILY